MRPVLVFCSFMLLHVGTAAAELALEPAPGPAAADAPPGPVGGTTVRFMGKWRFNSAALITLVRWTMAMTRKGPPGSLFAKTTRRLQTLSSQPKP